MEWRGQKDTTLRRVIDPLCENGLRPCHSFVRRNNPLAALPVQYRPHDLERCRPAASLNIDHTLTFTDA
jgi:hypothetical protein